MARQGAHQEAWKSSSIVSPPPASATLSARIWTETILSLRGENSLPHFLVHGPWLPGITPYGNSRYPIRARGRARSLFHSASLTRTRDRAKQTPDHEGRRRGGRPLERPPCRVSNSVESTIGTRRVSRARPPAEPALSSMTATQFASVWGAEGA